MTAIFVIAFFLLDFKGFYPRKLVFFKIYSMGKIIKPLKIFAFIGYLLLTISNLLYILRVQDRR